MQFVHVIGESIQLALCDEVFVVLVDESQKKWYPSHNSPERYNRKRVEEIEAIVSESVRLEAGYVGRSIRVQLMAKLTVRYLNILFVHYDSYF